MRGTRSLRLWEREMLAITPYRIEDGDSNGVYQPGRGERRLQHFVRAHAGARVEVVGSIVSLYSGERNASVQDTGIRG